MPPVTEISLKDVIKEHKKDNDEIAQFRKKTLNDIKNILKDKNVQENIQSKRFRERLAESLGENAPGADAKSNIFIKKMLEKSVKKDEKQPESLRKTFSEMLEGFYNTKMGKLYQGFAETVGGRMKEMFGNVMGHVKEVLGPVAEAFGVMKDFLVGVGSFFKKTFSTIFGSKQEKMDKKRNGFLQKISNYFTRKEKKDARGFVKKKGGILAFLLDMLGISIALILAPISFIIGFVKGIGISLKAIGAKFEFIGTTIGNIKKMILKGPFSKFFIKIGELFEGFKNLWKGSFGQIVPKINAIISKGNILTKPLKWIMDILRFAKGIGKTLGRFLGPIGIIIWTIDTIWKTISGFIKGFKADGIIGGIKGGIKGLFDGLIGSLLNMLKNASAWILDKMGFDSLADKLRSFDFNIMFSKVVDGIFNFFTTTIPNIFKAIPDYMHKLGNFMLELPGKILEWINNMPIMKAIKGGWKGIKDFIMSDGLKPEKQISTDAGIIEDRKVQVAKKNAEKRSVTKKINEDDLKKFRMERKRAETDNHNDIKNMVISSNNTTTGSSISEIPDSTDNYMLGLAVAGLA